MSLHFAPAWKFRPRFFLRNEFDLIAFARDSGEWVTTLDWTPRRLTVGFDWRREVQRPEHWQRERPDYHWLTIDLLAPLFRLRLVRVREVARPTKAGTEGDGA